MPLTFGAAVVAIGKPIAGLLLKCFLGAPAAAGAQGLLDIAATAIQDEEERYAAKRQFEQLSDQIIKHLRPLFDSIPDNAARAIADQLGATLSQSISTDLLLDKDLDPAKVAAALRDARPLPQATFGGDETALYERALDQVARYLVGVARELPCFDPKAVAAVLGRLRRMSRQLDKAIDGVARIERLVVAGRNEAATEGQRFEADYREAVASKLDYLELFGADVSEEARHHKLSVGYVSLTISASEGAGISAAVSADRLFATLAKGSGRLLVRGEAGSGKSTLVRWLAIQAASARLAMHRTLDPTSAATRDLLGWQAGYIAGYVSNPASGDMGADKLDALFQSSKITGHSARWARNLAAHRAMPKARVHSWSMLRTFFYDTFLYDHFSGVDRVPFVVRLRDCHDGRLPTAEDLPGQIASEIGRPPERWVRSVLDNGRALLLLDGVDEVPNNRRQDIAATIRSMASRYAKSWIVVTTRPTAVPVGWLRADDFSEAEINPLSEPDRAELIRRWHQAVAQELELQGRPQDLSALADNLINGLSATPSLARLATNPLLCAVICALHRDRRQILPDSQGELCEAICGLLLHRREAEAGIFLTEFPAEYRALTYKQKRAILQSIAHHMVDNQESSITEEAATRRTRAALNRFPNVDAGGASVVIRALVERSGMLRERRTGIIDFSHNTLRDYLAAEIFVEDDDVAKLARSAADDGWRQVVRFAAATDNRTFATNLVDRIMSEAEAAIPSEARRLRVVALDCRYAALNLDAATVGRVGAMEHTLVPPRTMEDADALAAGGDVVVPLLCYREMPAEHAAASVRALRLIGTPRAREVLTEYYGERRDAVINELCLAVNPLLLDSVRDRLAEGHSIESAVARQITDLVPLGAMVGLERLDLSGCTAIRDIGPVRTLKNLKSLTLPDVKISDISPITALTSLQNLGLYAPDAESFSLLSNCPSVNSLSLSLLTDETVALLAHLSRLEHLHIARSTLTSWADLAHLRSLRSLTISDGNPGTVEWLTELTGLRQLVIFGCDLHDASPAAHLPELQYLTLAGGSLSKLPTFPSAAPLTALDALDLRLSDLAPLADLANLRSLSISHTDVSDLSPLPKSATLVSLNLADTPVADIGALSHTEGLRSLSIKGTAVTDLAPLANLKHMAQVDITGTAITSLKPLRGLASLRTLVLSTLDRNSLTELLQFPHLRKILVMSTVPPELRTPLEARGVRVITRAHPETVTGDPPNTVAEPGMASI